MQKEFSLNTHHSTFISRQIRVLWGQVRSNTFLCVCVIRINSPTGQKHKLQDRVTSLPRAKTGCARVVLYCGNAVYLSNLLSAVLACSPEGRQNCTNQFYKASAVSLKRSEYYLKFFNIFKLQIKKKYLKSIAEHSGRGMPDLSNECGSCA